MIITKISKQVTLLEGFTPKTYKGIYVESYFNWEEMTITNSIREYDPQTDSVVNESEEILALTSMKVMPISWSFSSKGYVDQGWDIVKTFDAWIKSTILQYVLSRNNPFTNQPYFSQSDVTMVSTYD